MKLVHTRIAGRMTETLREKLEKERTYKNCSSTQKKGREEEKPQQDWSEEIFVHQQFLELNFIFVIAKNIKKSEV